MATTAQDIKDWFLEGLRQKATHMIIATDTFDYEDFPVYVKPTENVREKEKEYDDESKMLRVMEVYYLPDPFDEQVDRPRCFNYGPQKI